jgi:hypothetical protein
MSRKNLIKESTEDTEENRPLTNEEVNVMGQPRL